MTGMWNKIEVAIAKLAKEACYDNSGSASRSSMHEPEEQVEVRTWRETHESVLEKISKRFMK